MSDIAQPTTAAPTNMSGVPLQAASVQVYLNWTNRGVRAGRRKARETACGARSKSRFVPAMDDTAVIQRKLPELVARRLNEQVRLLLSATAAEFQNARFIPRAQVHEFTVNEYSDLTHVSAEAGEPFTQQLLHAIETGK
jgi:hypothetical protein